MMVHFLRCFLSISKPADVRPLEWQTSASGWKTFSPHPLIPCCLVQHSDNFSLSEQRNAHVSCSPRPWVYIALRPMMGQQRGKERKSRPYFGPFPNDQFEKDFGTLKGARHLWWLRLCIAISFFVVDGRSERINALGCVTKSDSSFQVSTNQLSRRPGKTGYYSWRRVSRFH